MEWIKRAHDSAGLTQYPVGKHLAAVQSRFSGSVVLCIDVSGSMSGAPLTQAVAGSKRFVDEALEARYDVAIVLWDSRVVASTELMRDRDALRGFLDHAGGGGGTALTPALTASERMLAERTGDRVVAVFSDGFLGDHATAERTAARLARQDIRVIMCGLGDAVAQQLDTMSTETAAAPRTATADHIDDAIADMASGLKRLR